MTMPAFPSRAAIERAEPLEFTRPAEKQANIKISGELNGLAVTVEFTAAISSIPAAIERLKAIGLSAAQRSLTPTAAPAAPQHTKTAKVAPEYNDAGDACCPKHHKPLREGQYGLYCPAKDNTTERGYCALKFTN